MRYEQFPHSRCVHDIETIRRQHEGMVGRVPPPMELVGDITGLLHTGPPEQGIDQRGFANSRLPDHGNRLALQQCMQRLDTLTVERGHAAHDRAEQMRPYVD